LYAGSATGNPFVMDCPADSMLTGLNVRVGTDDNITQLQGRCQTITSIELAVNGLLPIMSSVTVTTPVGGSSGSLMMLTCPAGYVVTELDGRFGQFGMAPLQQVTTVCTQMFTGMTTDSTTAGSILPNSLPFNLSCPVNGVAVGVGGYVSTAIERVQLRCR
jgi:hypothetical protein